jgi:glycosyltransferase involved in cell wall biosynthesis
MRKNPAVSVIMPNFNCSCYLERSIESILNQTFSDFELIIIDDASTDNSLEVIQKYRSDKRVNLLALTTNVGNYKARNIGIENAKGNYIAVMDADDLADTERLRIQYNYLKNNNQFFIGSQGTLIDQDDNFINNLDLPLEYDYLKISLLKNNCVTHSSLFYNRKALSEKKIIKYDSSLNVAADYAFITNCSFHFEVQNIPERLVSYRIHPNQISVTKNDMQIKTARYVRYLQIQRLHVKPTEKEMYLFNHFMENTILAEDDLVLTSDFLSELLRKNDEIKLYDQELLFVYFQHLFSIAVKRSKSEAWSLDLDVVEFIEKNFTACNSIFEFGSGQGTDLLLAKYNVVSIESDFRFLLKRGYNHKIYLAPIKDGWYDPQIVEAAFSDNNMDLMIIDGPPLELRKGLINNMHLFGNISCPIIFDDVNRGMDRTVMETFCEKLNYRFTIIKGKKKQFAICEKR